MAKKALYRRKDHLYHRAKSEGYRSRAAFKLLELNRRFRFLSKGIKVLDLGAWPGGWSQAAASVIGSSGIVIAVDMAEIEDLALSNVKIICGDAGDAKVASEAETIAGGKFDVVISDMSPKLTGIKDVDRVKAAQCIELALKISSGLLKKGGTLVIKAFKSQESEECIRGCKENFERVKRCELASSRKSSNEFYVVFTKYKGQIRDELSSPG